MNADKRTRGVAIVVIATVALARPPTVSFEPLKNTQTEGDEHIVNSLERSDHS